MAAAAERFFQTHTPAEIVAFVKKVAPYAFAEEGDPAPARRGHGRRARTSEPSKVRGVLAQQVGRRQPEELTTTEELLRREGRTEGKREVLVRLLRRRFGRLPAATVARIDKADAAVLDTWSERVLTAASIDEVVGTKTRRRA